VLAPTGAQARKKARQGVLFLRHMAMFVVTNGEYRRIMDFQ
jgi:hypothetical protein